MNYFVIQVLTRSEEKFIKLANRLLFGGRSGASRHRDEAPFEGHANESGGESPFEVARDLLAESPDERENPAAERKNGPIELPRGFSLEAVPGRLLWPRRKLTIRRRGIQQASLAPIFPGYVFYEAEELHPDVYWVLRKLSGYIRFLKNQSNLQALGGKDRELLLHFLSYGEIVDKSLVYFDENRKIRVKSGPMKGLEGRIVRVDKRKKRAKVSLSLYSDRFLVDFGFELLESAEGNERSAR